MSLDALCLANFKAFGSSQRVPLRPITLLFGANSAGKSSVLHSLALARHAVETRNLDVHRTRLGGDSIDLGGFGQYVHRRQRDQEVTLTFQLDPGGLSGRLREILGAAQGVEVEVGIGMEDGDSGRGRVGLQRFSVGVDGQELLTFSERRGRGLRLDRANHAHPIFREILRGILAFSTTAQTFGEEDLATLAGVVDELVPRITTWRSDGLFVRALEERGEGGVRSRIRPISRSRQEDLAQATRQLLPDVLRDLVGGLSGVVEGELEKLRYLGPLRSYPPRHLAYAPHHDPNWLAGGGFAWDEVRKNHEVRGRVNQWLGDPDHLKTPYELQVRELLPASELAGRLGGKLYELALSLLKAVERVGAPSDELNSALELIRNTDLESDVDSGTLHEVFLAVGEVVDAMVDAEGVAEEWARDILKSAKERADIPAEPVLVDKRSKTTVSQRDVGIGVSQVLPVLVSAYASRAKLIAIEQPEIHLHPALQAELGDVFLESALGEAGNRFLIETHSEHLILRILRRIRETSEGDEVPYPVKPEDVAVLYVQPGPKGAEVVHIPITPDGDFDQRWPDGFFAERAEELF
ncbi:MAG: DUF3696 domain-containing protein [Acidobacteriota bacterium]|nr:DUF3696 domain-containing protein [Acidobacteriota bacterium]